MAGVRLRVLESAAEVVAVSVPDIHDIQRRAHRLSGMPTTPILGLSHLTFIVRDVDRTARFFCEGLGAMGCPA